MDDLYLFSGSSGYSCSALANISNNVSVWNNRFGHPSNLVLNILKSVLKLSNVEHMKSCDICHRAKQHRKPFPLSNHKSSTLFELIHVDV